ncbi:MAG: hypothetical protein R6X32_17250 [Chloroflexota bacterium]
MMKPHLLLQRLHDIGRSLDQSGHALALIGLGSVGLEQNRLDAFSDLDFFAIVEPGCKPDYLANLDWLSAISPIAYSFANTVDGYKLLYADGIFCEFAVFEPDELQAIPFAAGRVVWKRPEVAETIAQSAKTSPNRPRRDQSWLLGEALTNLYVGMGRERRGERLSAMRFIQGYAVDRLLELVDQIEKAQPVTPDEFALERRFEQRYVDAARYAPLWLQGYEQNQASALAILTFLEQHFPVNEAMAAAIRELCG